MADMTPLDPNVPVAPKPASSSIGYQVSSIPAPQPWWKRTVRQPAFLLGVEGAVVLIAGIVLGHL